MGKETEGGSGQRWLLLRTEREAGIGKLNISAKYKE